MTCAPRASSTSSATGDFPTLSPTLLEEMESSTGLQGNFSEAELPKKYKRNIKKDIEKK